MTSPRFDLCIPFMDVCEGGYVNNPHDSGGPTNHGITLATLSAWRGQACTAQDVFRMSLGEAHYIFFRNYWVEGLPAGADLMFLDISINMGKHKASLMLQEALGFTSNPPKGSKDVMDGIIGPHTIQRAHEEDIKDILHLMTQTRIDEYDAIVKVRPDQAVFLEGWLNRTVQTLSHAQTMAGL